MSDLKATLRPQVGVSPLSSIVNGEQANARLGCLGRIWRSARDGDDPSRAVERLPTELDAFPRLPNFFYFPSDIDCPQSRRIWGHLGGERCDKGRGAVRSRLALGGEGGGGGGSGRLGVVAWLSGREGFERGGSEEASGDRGGVLVFDGAEDFAQEFWLEGGKAELELVEDFGSSVKVGEEAVICRALCWWSGDG